MKNLIVGIDPGKKGAIAFIDIRTREATVYDMPRGENEIIDLFVNHKDDIFFVAVEKQQPFPKQGVSSTFSLARHYGFIMGVIKTLGLSFEEIPPRKWQNNLFGCSKRTRNQSKVLSLSKARALFPSAKIGKRDGRSDALLIAEYARRMMVLENNEKS